MSYTKTNWENSPSTASPISASNLNKMENGIEDAHAHIADSTGIHGITDTADLVYTSDARLTNQRTPSDDSVTTAKVVNGAITAEKLASGVISSTQSFNAQTGTTYTLVLADADLNKFVTLNNSSSVTVTIPPDSSVAFPVGAVVSAMQLGAGQVTFAAGAGVTLSSEGARLKTKGQYAVVTLLKMSANNWVAFGNTAA